MGLKLTRGVIGGESEAFKLEVPWLDFIPQGVPPRRVVDYCTTLHTNACRQPWGYKLPACLQMIKVKTLRNCMVGAEDVSDASPANDIEAYCHRACFASSLELFRTYWM